MQPFKLLQILNQNNGGKMCFFRSENYKFAVFLFPSDSAEGTLVCLILYLRVPMGLTPTTPPTKMCTLLLGLLYICFTDHLLKVANHQLNRIR